MIVFIPCRPDKVLVPRSRSYPHLLPVPLLRGGHPPDRASLVAQQDEGLHVGHEAEAAVAAEAPQVGGQAAEPEMIFFIKKTTSAGKAGLA